jgi:hypothetical protein
VTEPFPAGVEGAVSHVEHGNRFVAVIDQVVDQRGRAATDVDDRRPLGERERLDPLQRRVESRLVPAEFLRLPGRINLFPVFLAFAADVEPPPAAYRLICISLP